MDIFSRKKRIEKTELTTLLNKITSQRLKCVTKRDLETYIESVVGKDDGGINVVNDCLVVMSGGKEVFRGEISKLKIGELLSLEGVSIVGPDYYTGEKVSIVAYYKYYRKL